jgi:tRNA nucleotidyltransferase (CCA-adding enzyme)
MSLKGISVERIEAEVDKLFLKSKRPSLGIRWLKDIGRLGELFPELAATIGVEQEPDWHPEGDVFEHTMQSIDAAAQLTFDSNHEKLMALYGVLCHDLGKAVTTKIIDGRLRSLGHEDAGVPLAKSMMKRFTRRVDLIDAVAKLVKHHMAPVAFVKTSAKLPAYKRLAVKLAPETNIQLLAKVSLADRRGRNGTSQLPLTDEIPEIIQFLKIAENASIMYKPEDPILHGRDVLGIIEPGPQMGQLLKRAYEIQIEQGIKDKHELLKRIL